MVPTAAGDPLLGGGAAPQDWSEILLSARAAQSAEAGPGDTVELIVQRTVGTQLQAARLKVTVSGGCAAGFSAKRRYLGGASA